MNGLKSPEEILLKHIPRIPDYVKLNLINAMKEYASQFTPIGESGEEEKEDEGWREKLFKHMDEQHNLILLDSELHDIKEIILPTKYPYTL